MRTGAAVAGVAVVLCSIVAAIPQTRAAEPTSVVVDSARAVGSVSAQLTGVNNDSFWDNSKGLWDPTTDAPTADSLAKIKRAGIGMIRFPGGTPANEFDWKKSIGPVDQRPCQANGASNGGSGPITSVAYGLDEYLKLSSAAGTTPEIMVPFANETAQDAADLVEYLNAPLGSNPHGGVAWAARRAENGHPKPYGVNYFEIGNEPDRGGQQDWRQGDPAHPADPTELMTMYALGGSQHQVDQVLSNGCDRRPAASVGTGKAHLELTVRYYPVASGSERITVDGKAWSAIDDLAAAGPSDQVYSFDPDSGTVRFGDGIHGAIPGAGAQIRADYTTAHKPGYVDFRAAMKSVDPHITVYSTWAPIRADSGLGTASFPSFMKSIGRTGDWDGISIHPYTNFGVQAGSDGTVDRDWETAREGHDQYMVGDTSASRLVDQLRADVNRNGPGKPVVISEFGALWFGGQRNISGYPHWETAMSHALYMASQWAHYSQDDLDWVMGNTLVSDPGGLRAVLGAAPDFVVTPDAVIRQQWSGLVHGGGNTLPATITGNPTIPAVDPPAGPTSYPALVATAAIGADGRLRIAVVNRDPEHAVTARVVTSAYPHRATAAVTTVAGADMTSYNSVDNPDAVTIIGSRATVGNGSFSYAFPSHSSTMITLSALTKEHS